MDLCQCCSDALNRTPKPPETVRDTFDERSRLVWRRPYREFRTSVSSCCLCSELWDYHLDPCNEAMQPSFFALSDDERDDVFVEGSIAWGGKSFNALIIYFRLGKRDGQRALEEDHGNTPSGHDKKGRIVYYFAYIDEIPVDAVASGYASPPRHVQFMNYWMQRCLGQHPSCRVTNEAGWLPKRLLDVGLDPCDTSIRLLGSEEIPPGSAYVTLSHRWNAVNMPKLTHDYAADFDIQGLPESFRDAVEVTRQLQVRYLWIDCLCINQDDPDDWKQQSAQMGMTYEFSLCNLSATAASMGGRGLQSSVTWSIQENRLLLGPINCSWNSRYHTVSQPHYLIRPEVISHFLEVEDAEINKRGWVLQERLLSPRTIHFAADTMHWECRESSPFGFAANNRIYSVSIPVLGFFHNKDWARRTQQAVSLFRSGQGSLNDLYKPWTAVRNAYAGTSVTYQSDKLVALSGLATAFCVLLSDTYLAGIWEKAALYDLLWWVHKPGKRSNNGSPSWSWASMEAEAIVWPRDLPKHRHDFREFARVVSSGPKPSPTTP